MQPPSTRAHSEPNRRLESRPLSLDSDGVISADLLRLTFSAAGMHSALSEVVSSAVGHPRTVSSYLLVHILRETGLKEQRLSSSAASLGDPFFLCWGQHEFFLVQRETSEASTSASSKQPPNVWCCPYGWVEFVTPSQQDADRVSVELFQEAQTKLAASGPLGYGHKLVTHGEILIRCAEPQRCVQEFKIYIKTDRMFQEWRVPSLELSKRRALADAGGEDDVFLSAGEGDERARREGGLPAVIPSVNVPAGYVKVTLATEGYSFLVPSGFRLIGLEDKDRKPGGARSALEFDAPAHAYGGQVDRFPIGAAKQAQQLMELNDSGFIRVTLEEPIAQFSEERVPSVQWLAERTVRELCGTCADWRVMSRPHAFLKKGGRSVPGDVSQWTCFALHVRTFGKARGATTPGSPRHRFEQRDVVVLTARRAYIPPTMQSARDFIVVSVSRHGDYAHAETVSSLAKALVESIAPLAVRLDHDKLVAQTVADALVLDGPALRFYKEKLGIYPRCFTKAKAFCEGLLRYMGEDVVERADVSFTRSAGSNSAGGSHRRHLDPPRRSNEDASSMSKAASMKSASTREGTHLESPLAPLSENLLAIGLAMEKSAPGLDAKSPPLLWARWRARVWRFLAVAVEGYSGLSNLSIGLVVKHWAAATDVRRKLNLALVLERLLYLKSFGEMSEYKEDGFALKVSQESVMRSCTFNETVMASLLEHDFVRLALNASGDVSMYPRFLVRLLRRGGMEDDFYLDQHTPRNLFSELVPAQRLRYAVLKRLVEQSAATALFTSGKADLKTEPNDANFGIAMDDMALNHLVPALISLIDAHPRDDKLRVLAVVTLVNFSKNNRHVKESILARGTANVLVQLLRSKNDDLVRHTCSILTNLTKSPEFRAQITNGPCAVWLADLIRDSHGMGYRCAPIVAQAATVIGNLSIDPGLRRMFLEMNLEDPPAVGRAGGLKPALANNPAPVAGAPVFTGGVVRVLLPFVNLDPAVFETSKASAGLTPLQCKERLCDLLKCTMRELEIVQASAAFALKNLAIQFDPTPGVVVSSSSSGNVKRLIGRLAGRGLLACVGAAQDSALVDILLRLVYVLCFDPQTTVVLRQEKIDELLEVRKLHYSDLVMQIKTKMEVHREN